MDASLKLLKFNHVTAVTKGFCLMDASFEMEPGYIYSLAGKNGAGKTTLLKCIVSDGRIYTGDIFLNGTDIRTDHAAVMQDIGFVSEDVHFFENRTCRQNADILGIFYKNYDKERFLKAMDEMELSPGKTYKKMSRGERLKFQLAFAMAHSPKLFLLDEVTVGMDPVFRIELFDILRRLIMDEEHGILMTSHNETEIKERTDYVGVIEDGIFQGFRESIV